MIPLTPVTQGQPERVGDPDRDLVVAGVGRLVAEQDQVGQLGRRPARSPPTIAAAVACGSHSPAVGDQVDRPVDPDRHHVAQLLLRLRRAQRQHRARSPPCCSISRTASSARALLVRADGEAEVAGGDRPLVLGQHDLAARQRNPLDAHQHVHGYADAGVVGIEDRRRVGHRDGHRVALAHVLDGQLLADHGVLGRQVAHQDVLADRRARRRRWSRRSAGPCASISGLAVAGRRPARPRACSA